MQCLNIFVSLLSEGSFSQWAQYLDAVLTLIKQKKKRKSYNNGSVFIYGMKV